MGIAQATNALVASCALVLATAHPPKRGGREAEREACGEWWDSASGAVHGLGQGCCVYHFKAEMGLLPF